MADSVISSGGLHTPRKITISSDAASPESAFRKMNRTFNRAPFQPGDLAICEKYESAFDSVNETFASASMPSSAADRMSKALCFRIRPW